MKYVVGVDEAGRGPLAGPVAVGIVRAPEGFDFLATFPGLNDSKKLSEKKREAIFSVLIELAEAKAIQVAVVLKSAKEIDARGIAAAIRNAVAEGVAKLLPNPAEGKVWLDGSLAAPAEYAQETVVGGDGLVPAIMLASIAAKVSRDRHMVRLSGEHPAYDFAKHKGYGTAAHIQAIRERGLSAQHRRSFCRNFA